MKKILIGLMLCFYAVSASAQDAEEAQNMGALAGAIMACGTASTQLYQFEEILSCYYRNTSPNEMVEKSLLTTYAKSKANTYNLQRKKSKKDCPASISAFSKMDIFKSELYSDGSVKTPEGRFLYPKGQRQLKIGATKVYPQPPQQTSVPQQQVQHQQPQYQQVQAQYQQPQQQVQYVQPQYQPPAPQMQEYVQPQESYQPQEQNPQALFQSLQQRARQQSQGQFQR